MYFNDDDKRMAILGEAAVVLARRDKEISVESLLRQLQIMAEHGGNAERLTAITDTRNWLMKLRGISSRSRNEPAWFAENRGEGESIFLASTNRNDNIDDA